MPPAETLKAASTYIITNVGTGNVIDLNLRGRKKVTGWSLNNGLNQMWTASQTPTSRWHFYNDKSPGDSRTRRYLQLESNHVDSVSPDSEPDSDFGSLLISWDIQASPGAPKEEHSFELSTPLSNPRMVAELNNPTSGSTIQFRISDSNSLFQRWTFTEVWPQAST